jgi:RNase P/RNase MRP subunit p30
MPMAVVRMAVKDPKSKETWKARIIVSFVNRSPYHFRLNPSMGKVPNCWGLKDNKMTTTMGANIHK